MGMSIDHQENNSKYEIKVGVHTILTVGNCSILRALKLLRLTTESGHFFNI